MACKITKTTVKETLTYHWTIKNFASKFPNKDSVEHSPPIELSNGNGSITFCLSTKCKPFEVNQALFCLWYCATKPEMRFQYRISILDKNESKQHTKEFQWHFKKSQELYCHYVINGYIYGPTLDESLVNGNLKLCCEVDVLDVQSGNAQLAENVSQDVMATNYSELLESGKLSDFTLVVGGKEFAVHKLILSARSPVFDRMFEHEMKEVVENRLELTDVDVEVFEQLLRYIYSGKVPDMSKFAADLFSAADKYQLDHLKSLCEQWLASNLTVSSVVSTLLLADLHNAQELKTKCTGFIAINSAEVFQTEDYKYLKKTRIQLSIELLETISINLGPLLKKLRKD